MYVMLDDFHHRGRTSSRGDAIAAQLQDELQDEIQRRPRQRLRRPAGRGPGHGRRLQDRDRGPRRHRPRRRCKPRPTEIVGRGQRHAGPRRASSPASGPTRPGSSSTSTASKVKTMGVSIERGLQHAPGLPRLALRQRLQPLRPHLAGQRPGRRRTSASRSRTSSSSRSATTSGGMVPLGTMAHDPRRRAARSWSCATTCIRPPRSTATPRRGSARARPSSLMENGRRPRSRQSMRTEWTELALLQLADRQHGDDASSCWPSSWSSSSWPRSTRAGRCRWP